MFKWLCRSQCRHIFHLRHMTDTLWTWECKKCGEQRKGKPHESVTKGKRKK